MLEVSMTVWQERLNRIQAGQQQKPTLVELMRLPDIVSWETGKVVTKWKVDPDFFTIGGQLFGGYIGALADQVLGHTTMTVLDDDKFFRTSELSITYYRPIREGVIWIKGEVAHLGRQLIHVNVDFRDESDNLLCAARGIQSINSIPASRIFSHEP
jgi:uncharacterized protein (TIGR00369 family)